MSKEILVADHVTKVYGIETKNPVTALSDVSLTMYEGDFICVMGPSGSGKSTFINNLSTIDDKNNQVYINYNKTFYASLLPLNIYKEYSLITIT